MNNEYIIINKENFQKTIEKLHNTYVEFGFPTSAFDVDLKEILSTHSTPLIPENIKPLQELVDEGYDPYDSAHHLQVQRMLKVIQDYISNLKINI